MFGLCKCILVIQQSIVVGSTVRISSARCGVEVASKDHGQGAVLLPHVSDRLQCDLYSFDPRSLTSIVKVRIRHQNSPPGLDDLKYSNDDIAPRPCARPERRNVWCRRQPFLA